MPHAELIAGSIQRSMPPGIEAVRDVASVRIPRWNLVIIVVEGEESAARNHSITTEIHAFHEWLPHGRVIELAVGLGTSHEQAVGDIVTVYMLLLFSTLEFLFEEHPHDCL